MSEVWTKYRNKKRIQISDTARKVNEELTRKRQEFNLPVEE